MDYSIYLIIERIKRDKQIANARNCFRFQNELHKNGKAINKFIPARDFILKNLSEN